MPDLMFEIWEDPEHLSVEMSAVSKQADKLRRQISPNATCVHSFVALSKFEAFQMNNDWHGWGNWKPPENVPNDQFTEEQVLEQRRYLAKRQID